MPTYIKKSQLKSPHKQAIGKVNSAPAPAPAPAYTPAYSPSHGPAPTPDLAFSLPHAQFKNFETILMMPVK